MNIEHFLILIHKSIEAQSHFREWWDIFNDDNSVSLDTIKAGAILNELEERLNHNYPFFHPRYAGQMIKPPHPIAIAAYLMAMQINPNNHALDGGPATAKMELEVIDQFATMFGYTEHLGHLTSSGTIANLEALWIARTIHPTKKIVFSSNAHYTHKRMCEVLQIQSLELDLNNCEQLEEEFKKGIIGTIVVTIGTTGLGVVEPLHTILPLAKKYGIRIHADCAYGGFFALLAHDDHPIVSPEPFLVLKECDSIVIDPHKHGLQPYGCGCVLFKDPLIGRFYKHDSPYTYFTSKDLHLGEISLECSRAGASAAALWATLKYFPLEPNNGFGTILKQTREAALLWSEEISTHSQFKMFVEPQLDIVTYFPVSSSFSAKAISLVSQKIFENAMQHPSTPLFLATIVVDSNILQKKFQHFIPDAPTTKILRSVLMKPEHKFFAKQFVQELNEIAKSCV